MKGIQKMLNFGFLLEGEATNTAGGGSSWIIYGVLLAVLAVFFIFTSRKNKKQERMEAEQRDNLQVGDEVTTIGGIIGMVVSVKAETFVLETTKDKTKIRFLKAAIRSVDVKAADKAAAILETKKSSETEATEESK
jgi:preprotein translocase subunit YajC